MGLFSLFSKTPDIAGMKQKNALVVDVRTPGEFRNGHVKASKNYPLQELPKYVNELKRLNRPLILCCASGMRSGQAARMLKHEGVECINGGSWHSVAKHY